MSANPATIDDQIMVLVSMGFELEDCQQAIENGKLSVPEAVDWILSGKPTNKSGDSATLKLQFNQSSSFEPAQNSATASNPLAVDSNYAAASSSSSAAAAAVSREDSSSAAARAGSSREVDSDVSTRLFVSDEQRLVKQRFEEKQRDEARKAAQEEKLAKKKAHEEALKRIQEDRNVRLRLTVAENSSVDPSAVATHSADSTDASRTVTSDTSLIQIRLPDGRCLKHSFNASSNLHDVFRYVEEQYPACTSGSYTLIQPFPRVEFCEQHQSQSLVTLGLVPTGSVVVKLSSSTPINKTDEAPGVSSDEISDTASAAPSTLHPPSANPQQPSYSWGPAGLAPANNWGPGHQPVHQWGHGQQLEDDNESAGTANSQQLPNQVDEDEMHVDDVINDAVVEMDDDAAIDDEEGGDVAGNMPAPGAGQGWGPLPVGQGPGQAGGFPGGFGRGRGGIGGGFGGFPGFGGGGGGFPGFGGGGGFPGLGRGQQMGGPGGQGIHNWGDGQRLAGDVLENALPHHRQDPRQLAAAAARKRYDTVPAQLPSDRASATVSLPTYDVPMLRVLVVKYVTACLSSARQTIMGLHGIPSETALQILDQLIKDALLRPKLLNYFISCHLNDITLDAYAYCTNELLAALRHHLHLKHVSLHSCSLITCQGLQHLTGLKNLRYLNIGSCRQIDDSVIPVLAAMPTLVTLVLENTSVTDAGILQYAASKPQHLQNLDLSRTTITQLCFSGLQAMPNLKQLNLEHTEVTGLSGVEGLQSIKILNLANTKVVTESVLCLRSLSLTGLNLANTINMNGDQALQYIADLKLVHFQLPNRMTTTDQGLQFIAKMPLVLLDLTNFIYVTDISMLYIGQIKTLHTLRLSNTKLTDAGMPFLEGLVNLSELHLDRTQITDVGASVVSVSSTQPKDLKRALSGIPAFSGLAELNLSYTCVTDDLLSGGTLEKCRELSKLNLSKTSVSDKGLTRLRLPLLTMLNIDDTFALPDIVFRLPGCPLLENVVFRTLRVPSNDEDM